MKDGPDGQKTTRRTLLKQVASAAIATAMPSPGHTQENEPAREEASSAVVTLEDSELRVTFDRASGALTGLEYKPSRWLIQRRPELGVSFRMQAPLPARHDNFILGQKQHAARVENQGNRVQLEWRQLVSEHAGVLPITFTATVTLKNGALSFESSLTNNSTLIVNTVEYPCLGDLSAPTPVSSLWREHMWYGNLETYEIHRHFVNEKGYWGVLYPTDTANSNRSLFCLIQSVHQGLYVQVSDHRARYLVQYTCVQKPGVLESIDNEVPEENEISGLPAHLKFCTTHFLFASPKSTLTLTPVVLRGYQGGWHAGVDLYKGWRRTWFKQRPIPDWVKEVHSWQQLQINSPEDSLRYRYSDLPKVGEECAHNDVRAIQLVGWNRGGQDRGNPAQDTDSRLGTWAELHDAIAQIQRKGVKIVLFGKFNWADMTTQWYKQELYKYDVLDPYGIPYQHGGYSYDTPTQLAAINNRRFAVMCFSDPAYREVAANTFKKDLALGPAGFLYDEVCHHGPALYCFATDHEHPTPSFIYNGDIPLAEGLDQDTHNNPEFLFAGEGPEDVLLQHYPLSYFRIENEHIPICRYIDPQAPLMVAVTGFDDREKLNRILMYRYIISYEPYNFKGLLSNFPLTLAYGKKIDALRRRYKRWLWDAEYRDTLGASVTVNGAAHALYSVFRTRTGERAVVVVNQLPVQAITAKVELPNPGSLAVVTPEEPDARPTSGTVRVPPRSAAVVLEQAGQQSAPDIEAP
jgi:hypothetical protein